MAKIENNDFTADVQIRAIEILNCTLNLSARQNTSVSSFIFNIETESKADATKKLVFVIVHVQIKSEDDAVIFGSLSVSCIYEIANFEEVIQTEAEGAVNIPQQLIETLNILSISTTRGIMFSTFKGTFLHGAVLPIIDPTNFRTVDEKEKNRSL